MKEFSNSLGRPRMLGFQKKENIRKRAFRALAKDYYNLDVLNDIEVYVRFLSRQKWSRPDKVAISLKRYSGELYWRVLEYKYYQANRWMYFNMPEDKQKLAAKPVKVKLSKKKKDLNKNGTLKSTVKKQQKVVVEMVALAKKLLNGEEIPGYTIVPSSNVKTNPTVAELLLDLKPLKQFNNKEVAIVRLKDEYIIKK